MGRNYIKNPSGLFNVNNISVANSATVARNTTTPLTRIADIEVSLPNNTNGYAEWAANTTDLSIAGQNCELRFDYIASSIGSQVFAQVRDTGTVVAQQQLSAASSPRQFSLNVPCNGTGATTTVRLTNATGNSGTSNIKVANMSYGKASNVGTVAQASFYGSVKYTAATNCGWQRSSTTFGNYTADTDCATPTATGNASAPSTKIPAIVLNNLPAGDYLFKAIGYVYSSSSASACSWRFSDGTNSSSPATAYSQFGGVGVPGFEGRIKYDTVQSSVTINVQAASVTTSTSCDIYPDTSGKTEFEILVYRFPSSSEIALRPDQTDYGWTAYTPTFEGLGTVSGVKVYHRKVGENLEVNGYFKPGTPSAVPATISLPAGLLVDGTKISNTTSTAWVGWANQMTTSGTPANFTATNRFHIFYDGSTGGKLFLAVQSGTSEFTKNNGTALYNSGEGASFFFSVPIQGWRVTSGAPLLVGSVTSNSSGLERVERLRFTNSGAPTIAQQSGSWVSSLSDNGVGLTTINITTGIFSEAPVCVCSVSLNGGGETCKITGTPTATAVQIQTRTESSGALTNSDLDANVICMGPR